MGGGVSTGALVTKVPSKLGELPLQPNQPGGRRDTEMASAAVRPKIGLAVTDQERVVRVQRAVDALAADEVDEVARPGSGLEPGMFWL